MRRLSRSLARQAELGLASGETPHRSRRSLKMLRSLLVLVSKAIGDERFRADSKRLRQLSDSLAKARRHDAMQEAARKLVEFAGETDESEAAKSLLAAATDGGETPDYDRDALAAELAAFRHGISSWTLPLDDPGLLLDSARKKLAQARQRIRKGLRDKQIETLHRGRSALIHHLHHLILLGRLGVPSSRDQLEVIEKLRGALGDINDLADAEEAIADPASALSAAASPELARLIRRRRKKLLSRSRKLLAEALPEKPSEFRNRIEEAWRGNPSR